MDFIANNWFLLAALIIILFLLFGANFVQAMHGVKSLNTSQAVELINREKGLVLDVCEPEEFEKGHIPQAKNVPFGKVWEQADKLEKFKNKPVIVTCRSGHRSSRAAVTLRKKGFEAVYTLSGGMVAWKRDNMPVER